MPQIKINSRACGQRELVTLWHLVQSDIVQFVHFIRIFLFAFGASDFVILGAQTNNLLLFEGLPLPNEDKTVGRKQ